MAPDGRFRIEGVERGAWTLVLATVNPPDVVRAIELAPGETRSLGIRLA